MAATLLRATAATISPTSLGDLPEDFLLFLLSRPSAQPTRELSPEDLARLEAVCYALRRPLLLPPNRRHSVVENAARARCLRHPLLAPVPAERLRAMAAQRCGGSWLRVLRFAWAMEEAWGLRRVAESRPSTAVGGRRSTAAESAEEVGGEEEAEVKEAEEAEEAETSSRGSQLLATAVYAGDYCSFQIKTNGDLWVYGSGSRDGTPQFCSPLSTANAPASNTPTSNPPAQNAPAPGAAATASPGWATVALAAGLAAVRLRTGPAVGPEAGPAAGSEAAGAQVIPPQVQRVGTRGRRGVSFRAQIVVGGTEAIGGTAGDGEALGGAAGESVVQVSGGRAFTVILTSSGRVYTMGQDSNGCCGHGQEGVGKKLAQPKLVEDLIGVPCQQVATGRSHTLVLARDGTVYAFGAGGNGRLGLGNTDDRCRPTVVEGLRPEVLAAMLEGAAGGGSNAFEQYRVVGVAAGASHSLAVTAGGVVLAFGRGHSGQLGGAQGWEAWRGDWAAAAAGGGGGGAEGRAAAAAAAGTAGGARRFLVPTRPVRGGAGGGGGARQIGGRFQDREEAEEVMAMATRHMEARGAPPAAAGAGFSGAGVSGGVPEDRAEAEEALALATRYREVRTASGAGAAATAAAAAAAAAAAGAAAAAATGAAPVARRVNAPGGFAGRGAERAVAIAGGPFRDADAAAAALAEAVRRGADLSDCLVPRPIGWLLRDGVTVMKVAASVDYSAAVDSLGRVFMWGSGYCGCLGNGSEANEVLPRVVEGLLHTRVVQVTLGKRKTLALDDSGRVFGFGWTAFGGLGVATGRDKVFSPTPVDAVEGKRVVQITTGAYHTVALCRDGACIGFGDNEQGQLELH